MMRLGTNRDPTTLKL